MSADRFDRFSEREERGMERNSERAGSGERGAFRRRKICRFCTEKEAVIDYRNAGDLKFFISERGKIVPRRISGNCAKHQRAMAIAVKRARAIALIPYAITG